MKNFILISVILLIASCYLDTSDKRKEWGKGNFSNEDGIIVEYDGIEREYVLYVPNSYDGNTSVPLLLNFHGGGGTATGQMYISSMNQVSDTAGFIIAYPQGSNLIDGSSHWNSMLATEDNKSTTDDIGFISHLIDQISFNYNINIDRVFACGYSNGADFSISLGCYLSNKISSVASVSGLMSNESDSLCSPKGNSRILMINGTSDFERPYGGIENYYLSVENTLLYWSTYHNTDSVEFQNYIDDNGNDIEQYTYYNSHGLSLIEHYKIINGGHDWFDISYQTLNIDQIIWNFFLKSGSN